MPSGVYKARVSLSVHDKEYLKSVMEAIRSAGSDSMPHVRICKCGARLHGIDLRNVKSQCPICNRGNPGFWVFYEFPESDEPRSGFECRQSLLVSAGLECLLLFHSGKWKDYLLKVLESEYK